MNLTTVFNITVESVGAGGKTLQNELIVIGDLHPDRLTRTYHSLP